MNKPTAILLAGAAALGLAGATLAPAGAASIRMGSGGVVASDSANSIVQVQADDTRVERRRWRNDWGHEDRGWRGDRRWRGEDHGWRHRQHRSRNHYPRYVAPPFFYGFPFYVVPPRRHHHW